jgi:hypothetical protein
VTQPFPGTPGWQLDQLARTFDEDWLDEWAHEYDAAQDFLDGRPPESLAALLQDLDTPATYSRYRDHIRHHSWAFTSLAQVDDFLAAVRVCAETRLSGDTSAGLQLPDGFPVRPHERRPDVAYPELVHLALYAHDLVQGDYRSPYLDEEQGPPDVAGSAAYRISQLGSIYLHRLLAEIAEVRALPTSMERLEAVGGTQVWDPEQDPDEWLSLVDRLVHELVDPWQRPAG